MVRDFRLQLNISHKYWLVFVFFVFAVANAKAVTPSAEQLEQFKKLPKDQQERIARQVGIDVSDVATQTSIVVPPVRREGGTYNGSTGKNIGTADEVKENKESLAKTLKPFGYDLFSNNAHAFMPSVDIPAPDNYVVGPGDSIIVQLYGKENNSYTFSVSREGDVHFPKIGPVQLAGLTFAQVREIINTTVDEQMIGVKSSVTMGAIRSIRIFVLGEVAQPGSYVVSSLSTMTNALLSSGGVTKIGSLRNVKLKRNGKTLATLDLYDLLLRGDTSNDARVLSGDVIFIPPVGKTVSVDGEVKRPAIYELKSEKTVEEVVNLAGGLLPTAYPAESKVQRIDREGNRTVIDLDFSKSEGRQSLVNPADAIVVPSVLDSLENIVIVKGHVKRPGIVSWKKGIRVSDVIGGIDELLPSPDLRVALIEREVHPTRKKVVLIFDPAMALTRSGSPADLTLEPRDSVRIFDLRSDRSEMLSSLVSEIRNQEDGLRQEQLAKISGHVRFPGTYPLVESMTAKDLIHLAGGLTNNAYSLRAEITRYTLDESQTQVIEHVPVDLLNSENQLIYRKDNLHVKRLPDWSEEQTISLKGELVFPGTYTLKQGETLSQIIARAGGLTEHAYPEAAVFTRQELRELESERIKQLQNQLERDIAASNIEQQSTEIQVEKEDATALLNSISNIKPLGRLVINLPLILSDPKKQDLILEDGDSFFVPKFKQSVTVVGEVQFPISHFYRKKLDAFAYIERSGGLSNKADRKRIYVVKPNGQVMIPGGSGWFSRGETDITPGDTVVVPLDSDRIKSLTLWTNVSEIFYQIALGAAAVASF